MQGLRSRIMAALPALLLATGAPAQDLSGYSGAQLYQRYCASCHGALGHGDGPVAEALRVMVPDLTRIWRRQGERFAEERLREIIDGRAVLPAHGTRYMPVWGYEFAAGMGGDEVAQAEAEAVIGRLVRYLREIQQ